MEQRSSSDNPEEATAKSLKEAHPERERELVQPKPPQGWVRRVLFFFPAALFIFLIAVLLWGILSDLLAGYG